MQIRDLEAFLAVVEAGSLIGASGRLQLTQPGVSRRIQALETSLRTTLLDRQSKPLKPTAAGREAYEHGRRMLRTFEDLKAAIVPHGVLRGEFRVGITPYISEIALTLALDQLRNTFSDLTLRITTGWPDLLVAQLRRGEIDVAAFCLPADLDPPDDLASSRLDLQPLSVVAPQHLALPTPTTLRDLSEYPWLVNPDGCGFRSVLRRRFEQERLPFKVGIEALSSDLRLSLVARGVGLSLTTRATIEASPVHAQLQIVSVSGFEPRVRAWVVHRPPAGRLISPIACLEQALVATLELALPQPDPDAM